MVKIVRYSAGMTSKIFGFVESKKMAELMAVGYSKKELTQIIEEQNLFSLRDAKRLRRTVNYVYERLTSLPEEALSIISSSDIEAGKVLVLVGIMRTDALFGEFVYEVYRMKKILGERAIENRDLNDFFDDKASQSDEVAGWSEASVKKLKNVYIRNLVDAGLLEDAKNRTVKNIILSGKVEKMLRDNGMEIYLKAIKGER